MLSKLCMLNFFMKLIRHTDRFAETLKMAYGTQRIDIERLDTRRACTQYSTYAVNWKSLPITDDINVHS